jgi:hypothetical protein
VTIVENTNNMWNPSTNAATKSVPSAGEIGVQFATRADHSRYYVSLEVLEF